MRNLCVLLIAAALAAPVVFAQANHDEYTALLNLCGKPVSVHDTDKPALGHHAIEKDVKYAKLEFFFMKDDEDINWSLTGAFPRHGEGVIDRGEASAVMPCVKGFVSWDPSFMSVDAPG